MKKLLVLLLCLGIAGAVMAQEPTAQAKPSAAIVAPQAENPTPATGQAETAMPAEKTATAQPLQLPVGTAVRMKLETPISTQVNKAGDRFSGRVTEAVVLEGKTVIPVGASLEGRVVRTSEPRRIRGTPTIDLHPDVVVLPNGDKYSLDAVVVDTSARPETSVNDEGQIKGRGHDGKDWREMGIGAGAGAGVGALVTHDMHGTLIGAGVGATASVVHWMVKRRSANLPAGTEIIMELSRPMALSAGGAGQ